MAVVSTCMRGSYAQQGQGTVVGSTPPGTMDDTFTIPFSDFNSTEDSGCGDTLAGCTGTFVELAHAINGTVTVIDDCTFRIQGWQFDGLGPDVEWWGSKQEGSDTVFPYPANAIKIGELGTPGSYQTGSAHGGSSDVVVRLGKDSAGTQIELSEELNHISVWCQDVEFDFGNAALKCDTSTSTNGGGASTGSTDTASAGTGANSTATGTNSTGTGTSTTGTGTTTTGTTSTGTGTTSTDTGSATGGTTSTGTNTEPSAAYQLLSGMKPVGAVVGAMVSLALTLM